MAGEGDRAWETVAAWLGAADGGSVPCFPQSGQDSPKVTK